MNRPSTLEDSLDGRSTLSATENYSVLMNLEWQFSLLADGADIAPYGRITATTV